MITYGLSALGFRAKQQQEIINELKVSIQGLFGQNTNFAPQSNFGQLTNILSEREALLWQLAEAVYSSQSPNGAEGTSVDNILAFAGLRRLSASPTRTASSPVTQSNGIVQNGLVLGGVAGTVISQGSIIQTTGSPPVQFTLDSAVTIAAAVNAIQSLFFSNTPNTGAFQLGFPNALTPSMPFNILAQSSSFKFASVPTAGAFSLMFGVAGVGVNTPSMSFNSSAGQIQTAIQTMSGHSTVTVTGSMSAGFVIGWGATPNPILSLNTNTTGVAATFQNSFQANINNLQDSTTNLYPFTDVSVVMGATGFNFNFGANTPASGQASSGDQAQPIITISANNLMNSTTVTNLNIVTSQTGSIAKGIGSATCKVDGPNFIGAGALTVIGTSISGWNTVNNELDCITGSNIENDTQALVRRINNLQAHANGPLQSIIQKVRAIANVITAIGFENLNEAALQRIHFPIQPTSGKYNLVLQGIISGDVAYNATAAQIQTILRAYSGFEDTLVTGDAISDFIVDFNGSLGGQPVALMTVTTNTTGGAVNVTFDRPGKSFEIVADGGDNTAIAATILGSKPAGIQTYGGVEVPVFDTDGNQYNIEFSRPTQVPFYVKIVLQTDFFTADQPEFNPASVTTIQQDIVALGNQFGIGGLVIGRGTKGLVGAFNDVPGILNYTLVFERNTNPTSDANIQVQSEEVPVFESFNISVSYT